MTEVDEIKSKIAEMEEILKAAYRSDPKYQCGTCGGSGKIMTEYFGLSHTARLIVDHCPDCFGKGYDPKLDMVEYSKERAKVVLDKLDACPGDKNLIDEALDLLDRIAREEKR